jgi:predicted nucleotidyltransferase
MEQVLNTFVREVQHLYGSDLVAIFLYGSAVTGEHVPGRSDINVAVLLSDVTPSALRKASGSLGAWARRGFATPMFFDPEFLRDALDVFPIELLDMQERHRMLYGPDVLAGLRIEAGALRRQCEQELRGKLLKLRQAYLESSRSPTDLQTVLTAAASGLIVLARTLLHLARADESGGTEAVFRRVETQFGVRVAHLRKAWQLKRGEARVTGSEIDLLYQAVLEEFQRLVRVVDGLPA